MSDLYDDIDETPNRPQRDTVDLACHRPALWEKVVAFLSTKCSTMTEFLEAFDKLHNNKASKVFFRRMGKDVEDALDGRIHEKMFLEKVRLIPTARNQDSTNVKLLFQDITIYAAIRPQASRVIPNATSFTPPKQRRPCCPYS